MKSINGLFLCHVLCIIKHWLILNKQLTVCLSLLCEPMEKKFQHLKQGEIAIFIKLH